MSIWPHRGHLTTVNDGKLAHKATGKSEHDLELAQRMHASAVRARAVSIHAIRQTKTEQVAYLARVENAAREFNETGSDVVRDIPQNKPFAAVRQFLGLL